MSFQRQHSSRVQNYFIHKDKVSIGNNILGIFGKCFKPFANKYLDRIEVVGTNVHFYRIVDQILCEKKVYEELTHRGDKEMPMEPVHLVQRPIRC